MLRHMTAGVKVVAPAAGVAHVHYGSGYGNYVDVVDGSGKTHRMAHLQGGGLINNGAHVVKGQVVGLVGNTGASTGPHLHYEQHIGGAQVGIHLEGPGFQWGPRTTADGDRRTIHAVRSSNCLAAPKGVDSPVDVVGWSRDNSIRIARSNRTVATGWRVAVPQVSNPTLSDACNFDRDRGTELISYEAHLKHFVMGNPRGDGKMDWSVVLPGIWNITDFKCIDWNGDGRSDVWARDASNRVYVGYSNGTKVYHWQRQRAMNGAWATLGDMEFLENCDLNGDGRREIVSYEANRRFMIGRPHAGGHMRWDVLLNNVYNIDATSCGNFNPKHRGTELIGWQMYRGRGTFVIGEFASNFRHERWDPMTQYNVAKPFKGELDSGDIDADGVSELLSHEYRGGHHFIMVADFNSPRTFRWRQFLAGVSIEDMNAGRFH